MRRPLIPFVTCYIYGIIAAELFIYLPITFSLVSVLLCTSGIYLWRVTKCPINKFLPLLIVTGVVSGFFYMLYASRVPQNDISRYATGDKLTVIGMVDGPPGFSSMRVVAHIRALKILRREEELNVSGRIRLTVYDPEVVLRYGDIIKLTGRLKTIRGFKNPGLFDYARYIAREGIRTSVGVGKKENISKVGTGGTSILRRIYGWREEIRLSIVNGLSGPSSAILQAMVIGATGDLTPELRDKFNAAGVTHILSISGSHLGFVTLLVFFIIRYILIYLPYRMLLKISIYTTPSKIAALGTLPTVILYTLLSGSEIATVRSLIMAMVYLAAILIEREDDAINTLIVAALLVLLWDPQALFDISFQLSYMAVLSMVLVTRKFYKIEEEEDASVWRSRYYKKFKLLLLLTLCATISTAPIVAHYYNQITWVGLISNMIVVPFVGFAVLPAGLFTSSLVLILHTDVIPLAWLNETLLSLLYKMIDIFARLPLSIVYAPSPAIPFIISMYAFFLSLLFLKKLWAKILLPASILLMVFLLSINSLTENKAGVMRTTFIDVGQGDSALIEFPDGEVMIIDGGGTFSETFDTGRSIVAPYLWNRRIRKIGYVVSTHPQLDHVEGLAYIVDKFRVGEVWINGIKGTAAFNFDRIVQSKGIKQVIIHRDIEDKMIGGCSIHFLNPPYDMSRYGWKDNDLSIAMRLACKDISLLFTSDIEARAIREIISKDETIASTVIKVPHHGARGSVEEDFLSAVKPGIAVISAGYQNSYHHPSPEAISAYERIGAAIYRTDIDGAVIIEAKDGGLKIKTYKDMALKEVEFGNPGLLFMTELSNLQKIVEGYDYGC